METSLKVKQIRSIIGKSSSIRLIVKGLGLKGIGDIKILNDTLAIRGMIRKVQHIVRVSMHKTGI